MERTELHDSLLQAGKLKEYSHTAGDSMIPIVELVRNDALIGIIGMSAFETNDEKHESWTQCLYAARSLGCDTIRLLIDAHMSKYPIDVEFDDENFVKPSQDPKAVDVILAYEWKDGQTIAAMMHEYHVTDDGTLKWEDPVDFPEEAVESWMNDKVAWAYSNPKPLETSITLLGEFMEAKGHTMMLVGGVEDAGR